MAQEPNYMTPEGFEHLRQELHELLHTKRPAMARAVGDAAAEGDRSENAEYIYGKKRLREIDKRIHFLQQRLDIAEVVPHPHGPPEKIVFGATVVLEDEEGESVTYRVVGQDEIDPARGWISWSSPVGRALIGKRVEDTVRVQTPAKTVEYTVLEIAAAKG